MHDAMKLFDLQEPFSHAALKAAYRKHAAISHPDHGGDAHQFVIIQRAYEQLVSHCHDDVRHACTVDGICLADLGKGYPITESACTCTTCDGKGYQRFHEERGTELILCPQCFGFGVFSYVCNKCGGTGAFRRHDKVVGECRICKGTGRFFPVNRRPTSSFWSIRNWEYIPGTRLLGHRCRRCEGSGEISVPRKIETLIYRVCPECKGVGEIKMWNPVLPRGLLQSISHERNVQ